MDVVLQWTMLLHRVLVMISVSLVHRLGRNVGCSKQGGHPLASGKSRVGGAHACHSSQSLSEGDQIGGDCGNGRGDLASGRPRQVEALSSCGGGGGIGVIGVLEMLMQYQGHSRYGCAEVLVVVELVANLYVLELGVV